MTFKEKLLQIHVIREWKRKQQQKKFKGSEQYWEGRYQQKGNSGSGSYDHLAEFKSDVLNAFVKEKNVKSIIEFGSGDGNQLKTAIYPAYIGLDVSPTAVKICDNLFKTDKTKSFYVYNSLAFCDNARLFQADLTLSLDVLYHLVEKEIFEAYLLHLFSASNKYVIIYASDYNQAVAPVFQHENRRSFTDFVTKNLPHWKLTEVIKNKYNPEEYKEKGSLSDFFIYEKTA